MQGWCRTCACASSDRPLDDFQASAAVEDHLSLAEIGAKLPRLELPQAHLPGDRTGARELALLEVDADVAGLEPIAVRPHDADRAADVDLLPVEVVAAVAGGDHQRTLGQPEPGEHPFDVDDRHVRAALDRALR